MSTQNQTPEITRKPLQGKYDGRGKYKRTALHKRAIADNAPKPKWLKNFTVSDSLRHLDAIDAIASPSDIFRTAYERGLLALCWQIRERVEDRLLGKPYTAENPNAVRQPSVLNQDNRLQIAIQQLLPSKGEAKAKRKPKAKLLEGNVVSEQPLAAQPEPGASE